MFKYKNIKRTINCQVDGIFEVQQFVNLSWRDPRIQFHNLKLEDYQNSLLEAEKQIIWIPTATFLNTADQVIHKDKKIKNYTLFNFLGSNKT